MTDSRAQQAKGRPKIAAEDLRGARVTVRFSGEEQAALEGMAAEAGLSVSAFVRAAALGARITVQRDGVPMAVVGQLRRIGNNLNQVLKEARYNNFPPHIAAEAETALQEVSRYLRSAFHDA